MRQGRSCGDYLVVACLLLVPILVSSCVTRTDGTALHFESKEGLNLNSFVQEGKSAAHLVLRSGRDLRVLVAFPAGNSGTGLWFEPLAAPTDWVLDSRPKATTTTDTHGRPLHGIAFEASVAAETLTLKQAVLSNVRVLRDYDTSGTVPAKVRVGPTTSGNTLTWARDRLDGAAGYRLGVEVVDGTVGAAGTITAGGDGRIRLRVTASTGERPLTPLTGDALFNGAQTDDTGAKNTLAFLSYREKFLAGSWRFDTYFGRDTLLSVRLLMPVLAPSATEAGLGSVVARLSPDGEVAHEEAVSEYAMLTDKKQHGTLGDAPIMDYSMIDENYLLAPVVAAYLLDDPAGAQRASAYLRSDAAAVDGTTISVGQALLRNLRFVASTAAPFADKPDYRRLISLKEGHDAGQWRDSADGIGGGRYPYDVNAELVPAALEATARLLDSRLLDPFLERDDRTRLGSAGGAARIWRAEVPRLFTVTLDNRSAATAVGRYAEQIGVQARAALASLGPDPVEFAAISLDADGKAVPVLHSDETFDLLFATPRPDVLDKVVTNLIRPFPLGLMTDVGMVVANPAFADPDRMASLSNHAYHGTVVWSWQHAMFASGLARQLARTDVPQPIRDHLTAARRTLWQAIDATETVRNSELWSWHFDDGRYRIAPFGASASDSTESSAAQLWSTAYLAVQPPAR